MGMIGKPQDFGPNLGGGDTPGIDLSGIDIPNIQDNIEAAMLGVTTQELQTQKGDVQLNPLPSLPSISNVGSVPFTGTVSNIPGGFQPLPQVAGGRKKLYQLSQFHGGVNLKSSPRDISDQECQKSNGVSFADIGKIKLLGLCTNTNNSITTGAASITDRGRSGYGLFQFVAPADTSNNAGETVITLTPDGGTLDAHNVISASQTNVDGWIPSLGSDNSSAAHVIYAAGNGVYACNSTFVGTPQAKIYVYREDQNETVSGWAEGTPLIASPLSENKESGTVAVAGKVNIEDADLAASNNGSMNVCIVPSGTGGWDGEYYFYVSWLFDGGVETGLTAIGTDTFTEGILSLNPSLVHTSGAPLGGNKRIEGGRIYFKEAGTAERWLLAEFNLADGVKGALDSTFIPWTIGSDVHDLAALLVFDAPPSVYSYASLNGYYANEVYAKSLDLNEDDPASGDGSSVTGPTAHDVKYKTAVVGSGGIVFIGNVKFRGKHMPDSMMFSMTGKPGVFPQYNRFDSPSSDGSPIRALAAYRDTILQFKENGMYVINVSNPAQSYAQASFRDCGVYEPCQVFTTSFGVIFANKHGCFIYDGQKVISLTGGKFTTPAWGIAENHQHVTGDTSNVPCVGYDPRSQNIIVLKDIGHNGSNSNDAHVYSMLTQSWSAGANMIANADNVNFSNFIITSGGYLSILNHDETALHNYNHVPAASQSVDYITKDLDFGLPTQTKKIFKVYVTYLGDGSGVTVTYGADGDSTPTEAMTNSENSGATLTSAGTTDHNVATFTLNSHPANLKSIALKFAGTVAADFEINDISILYRVRPIK